MAPTPPQPDRRRPHSVYAVGSEPDVSSSLANERTALAWLRTALALVAGGIGLVSVSALLELPRWVAVLGSVACFGAAVVAAFALHGWARTEKALRLGQPVAPSPVLIPLCVGVILFALAAVVLGIIEAVRST